MTYPKMSLPVLLALVALPAAALAACATGSTGGGDVLPASEVARTEPDGEAPGEDGGSADGAPSSSVEAGVDGGPAQPTVNGCKTGRVAKADACDEPCDARLTLPGGGTYCTVQCAAPSECDAPSSGLACPTDVGACMPRCTSDATCKAMGFARCVLSAGACDTL